MITMTSMNNHEDYEDKQHERVIKCCANVDHD